MKKREKENISEYIISSIVEKPLKVLVYIFIYIIISMLFTIIVATVYGNEIISKSIYIGYLGNIFGGLITLLGVGLTIIYSDYKSKNAVKPIVRAKLYEHRNGTEMYETIFPVCLAPYGLEENDQVIEFGTVDKAVGIIFENFAEYAAVDFLVTKIKVINILQGGNKDIKLHPRPSLNILGNGNIKIRIDYEIFLTERRVSLREEGGQYCSDSYKGNYGHTFDPYHVIIEYKYKDINGFTENASYSFYLCLWINRKNPRIDIRSDEYMDI